MDTFLPPASPEQIADVYAQLRVTHQTVLLTRWEVVFVLISLLQHLALPWVMLAAGFSAALRERAARGAAWLTRQGFLSRLIRGLDDSEQRFYRRLHLARLAEWDMQTQQWLRGLRLWRDWDPTFFRTAILYAGAYSLLYRLTKLPVNIGAYSVGAAFGLTHLSSSAWIGLRGREWLEGFALNTLGAVLVLWLIRFSPRRWPILLAFLFSGLSLTSLWLPDSPNADYRPLPSGGLSQRLHALATRAGLPRTEILVDASADGQDDSNAYAGRSGDAPRILLTRRMLDTEPPGQVEAAFAHEIGHAVHRDDVRTFLPTVFSVFVAFPFIRRLAEWMLTRFGPRWRVASLADPAALPALLLAYFLVTLMTDPLANAYSRALEHQADAYCLGLTRDRLNAARLEVSDTAESRQNPDPPAWFAFLFYDHPTGADRVRFDLTDQPEQINRPSNR